MQLRKGTWGLRKASPGKRDGSPQSSRGVTTRKKGRLVSHRGKPQGGQRGDETAAKLEKKKKKVRIGPGGKKWPDCLRKEKGASKKEVKKQHN